MNTHPNTTPEPRWVGFYGSCPVCNDPHMAFEYVIDPEHAECGGCGSVVLVSRVQKDRDSHTP
jgi:hypothetical protein